MYVNFWSLNSCEYMTFYERDKVELGPLNVDYHVYLEQYHQQNNASIHSIMKCRNYQTMPVIYTVIMARVKFNKKLSDFRYARVSIRADVLTNFNTPRFLHQKNKYNVFIVESQGKNKNKIPNREIKLIKCSFFF